MTDRLIDGSIEEYGRSYKADESQHARKILEDMHQEIERSIADLNRDIAALRKRIEGKEAQIGAMQKSQANITRAILVLTKEGM